MLTKDNSPEKVEGIENQERPTPSPRSPETLASYKKEILDQIDQETKLAEEDGNIRLERVSKLGVSPEKMVTLQQQCQIDERLKANSEEMNKLKENAKNSINEITDINPEASPESNKNTREQKREYIRESFGEMRGNLLKGELTWEMVNNGANLIPFAGGGKMLVEAIAGKEAHGEKLTGKDRIIHGAIGAGSLALDFTGVGVAGKGAFIVGRSVGLFEKIGAQLAQKGAKKSSLIFLRTAKFLAEHPNLTLKGEEFAQSRVEEMFKNMDEYKRGNRVESGDLATAA